MARLQDHLSQTNVLGKNPDVANFAECIFPAKFAMFDIN